jgi:hypothetical protein
MIALEKLGALALITLLASSGAQAQTCVGDCNGNGMVGINELVLGVNISLGLQPVSACEAFDCQNNGMVGVNCLIQGVNNSLLGCGPHPTPTATPPGGGPTPTATTGGGTQTRTFTLGNNMSFAVGGCCGASCDNQTAGVDACMNNAQCSGGQECAEGQMLSRTGLFNGSPLGNTNAADMFTSAPLMLQLGAQDSMGVAPLKLLNDVLVEANIFGGAGCLCLKLFASGSTGSIDCNGGTKYDTSTAQPLGTPAGWTVETGLGDPSGPGDGNLIVMGQLQFVSNVTCDIANCPTVTFTDPPVEFPFTTTNAIALKGPCNPPTASCIQLTNRGESFNCATFSQPDSGGALAAGGEITILGLETANTIRMAE